MQLQALLVVPLLCRLGLVSAVPSPSSIINTAAEAGSRTSTPTKRGETEPSVKEPLLQSSSSHDAKRRVVGAGKQTQIPVELQKWEGRAGGRTLTSRALHFFTVTPPPQAADSQPKLPRYIVVVQVTSALDYKSKSGPKIDAAAHYMTLASRRKGSPNSVDKGLWSANMEAKLQGQWHYEGKMTGDDLSKSLDKWTQTFVRAFPTSSDTATPEFFVGWMLKQAGLRPTKQGQSSQSRAPANHQTRP